MARVVGKNSNLRVNSGKQGSTKNKSTKLRVGAKGGA